MHSENVNPRVFAHVHLNGRVKGHGTYSAKSVSQRIAHTARHYTMARQGNRQMTFKKLHPWKVTPAEARKIQENLRTNWEAEDRLPQISTIAGLDAVFVLTD